MGVAFLETPGNAVDRIDNDGDSPETGPYVTQELLQDEISRQRNRLIMAMDLIDENQAHIAFGDQKAVVYADGIDQSLKPGWTTGRHEFKVETNSPLVTQQMVDQSAGDKWKRWPPFPETDPIQNGKVHLIMVETEDIG